ncbi:MAG: hypothetical protein JSV84_15220 [Gemmatimonadota bacterium]|nr:MAG: hypothetical protein JSV84_15220 [Gemmatimonadota bacterium]
MAKRTSVLVLVVTMCLTVAMFAGSGDDTKKGVSRSGTGSSLADVPGLINYQGVLTDDGGNPLDTTVSMTFTVYDSETGGTAEWTDTHGSVTVTGGLFNVLLSIPSAVFGDPDRWLGLAVGDDPEMTPRQRMASVPYAYWSGGGSGTGECWNCPDAPDSGPVYTLLSPVGIGTTEPESDLHVIGNSYAVKGENDESYGCLGHSLPGIPTDWRVGVYGKNTISGNYGYIGGPFYGVYGNSSDSYAGFFMGDVYVKDNVGIGATNPVAKLDVMGSIALGYGDCLMVRDSFSPGTNKILKTGWDGVRGDYLDLYVPGVGESNEGVKMSLTENGHVAIGTTDPGSHRIHVTSDGGGVAGATAFIENTSPDGLGMIVEATSTDLPLLVTQKGEGDIFRCDSWTGGWHVAFRVENDGRTTCSVLQLTGGSDIAEPFDVVEPRAVEPGMVVVIDPENPGKLKASNRAYDRCVAGIVSGGGGVKPGLILTQEELFDGDHQVALTGRVYGLCDASYGSIEPGDLLTTSPTPGYAMKVTDYEQAQGAILGKAMTELDEGRDLVLVLVSLQ